MSRVADLHRAEEVAASNAIRAASVALAVKDLDVPLVSLTTISSVVALKVGMDWPASTGDVTFTAEDLVSVVEASKDPTIPRPRVKLGHTDPRYNGYDGTPNLGFMENVRLSDTGMAIVTDLVSVPKWLETIMPVAYPSRSIEGEFGYGEEGFGTIDNAGKPEGWVNFKAPSGREYPFVITAIALLGAFMPGCLTLEDIPLLYGDTVPDFIELAEEAA